MKQVLIATILFGLTGLASGQEDTEFSESSEDVSTEGQTTYDEPLEDNDSTPTDDGLDMSEGTQESPTEADSNSGESYIESQESAPDPTSNDDLDPDSGATTETTEEPEVGMENDDSASMDSDFSDPAAEDDSDSQDIEIAKAPTKKRAAPAKAAPNKKANLAKKKSTETPLKSKNRKIQLALQRSGEKIKVDGVIGKHTMAAIKRFQIKNALSPTGRTDSQTLKKLGVN
jgi:hypothetical protein